MIKDERLKELMISVGMPDSKILYQALKQCDMEAELRSSEELETLRAQNYQLSYSILVYNEDVKLRDEKVIELGAENAKLIAERDRYKMIALSTMRQKAVGEVTEDNGVLGAVFYAGTEMTCGETIYSLPVSALALQERIDQLLAEREATMMQSPVYMVQRTRYDEHYLPCGTYWLEVGSDRFSECKENEGDEFVGRIFYASPLPAQQIDEKLDKPARVNATIFREGVSERLVIEAAQRYYEWRIENPPEGDKEFQNKVLDFIDGQAQQIPEGYTLVPIEPTEEMRDAANRIDELASEKEILSSDHFMNIYKAMVLSASQPKGESK